MNNVKVITKDPNIDDKVVHAVAYDVVLIRTGSGQKFVTLSDLLKVWLGPIENLDEIVLNFASQIYRAGKDKDNE